MYKLRIELYKEHIAGTFSASGRHIRTPNAVDLSGAIRDCLRDNLPALYIYDNSLTPALLSAALEFYTGMDSVSIEGPIQLIANWDDK